MIQDGFRALMVSIHAPAQGATGSGGDIYNGIIVSIHAPAQGATIFVQ